MEFLNPSEKIKQIRKKLNMNQEDLVDKNLTRGFISMIETGRRGLSRETAEIISDKFKSKADKLGIDLNVDADYILRDTREEAEFYCTENLKNTQEADDINGIISIAKEYHLENILLDSYMHLGEIALSKNDYIKAHMNYMNALSYCKDANILEKVPYLYNKLGHCKANQLQFLEALTYFNLSNYYATMQNNDAIKKMSVYNIAICNKKLNRIDAALEYIDISLSICNKDKDFIPYVYTTVLKSICYESKNSIDTSIHILLDLLKEFKHTDEPLICYVYDNLGYFYLRKGDFENSLNYYNKSEEIRSIKDIYNLSHTIIEKASVYIDQKLYEQAISSLKEGLDLADKNNDMEYLIKGYHMLADIYVKLKLNNEAQKTYESLLSILQKDNNNKNEKMKVLIKITHLYLEQNNNSKLQEILLELDGLISV